MLLSTSYMYYIVYCNISCVYTNSINIAHCILCALNVVGNNYGFYHGFLLWYYLVVSDWKKINVCKFVLLSLKSSLISQALKN